MVVYIMVVRGKSCGSVTILVVRAAVSLVAVRHGGDALWIFFFFFFWVKEMCNCRWMEDHNGDGMQLLCDKFLMALPLTPIGMLRT
jgi:hypothetical protein